MLRSELFAPDQWEKYDKFVDSLDEERLREALKAEARVRAHYQDLHESEKESWTT